MSEKRHYGGRTSRDFWRRIHALPTPWRDLIYRQGVVLQDQEEQVLRMLGNAEKIAEKIARRTQRGKPAPERGPRTEG